MKRCGCYGVCRCRIQSSAHPYLCRPDDCAPVFRRSCCNHEESYECEPECGSEYPYLSVNKRVIAACPPSQVREVLPVVCQSMNCPVPRVSYLFEIEIKNFGEKTVTLTAIFDSLTNSVGGDGGFLDCRWKARVSAQFIPKNDDPVTIPATEVDTANLLEVLMLNTSLFPGTADLEQCDCLIIQLYLEDKEPDNPLHCLTELKQEVLVLGTIEKNGTEKFIRRTGSVHVPL